MYVIASIRCTLIKSISPYPLTYRAVGRDYSLIVFLSAHQMADRPQLKLANLRKEFAYASQALLAGPDPDSAFFVEMVGERAVIGRNQRACGFIKLGLHFHLRPV